MFNYRPQLCIRRADKLHELNFPVRRVDFTRIVQLCDKTGKAGFLFHIHASFLSGVDILERLKNLALLKMLIGVSGVGPKAALAILSVGTPESLAMAIVTGDEKSLTAAPGVGKKIAQRIILELKDKMAKETASGLDFSGGNGTAAPVLFASKASEAAQALAVLGYSSQETAVALKGLDMENLPLEEIVRQGLKRMAKS